MPEDRDLSKIVSKDVPQPPTNLCAKCQQSFNPWPQPESADLNFRWYDTVEEARRSAANGCGLCIQLVKNGRYEHPHHTAEENVSNVGKFAIYSLGDGVRPEEGLLVLISMYRFEDPVKEDQMTKHVWTAKAFLIPGVKQAELYDSIREPSSINHTLELCKRWLQYCNTSHACRGISTTTPETLPTRLIEIDGDEPRLCADTSSIDTSTQYASLSHCWGLKKFLTLVKSNLSNFTQCIPLKALPKTFQEAIFIAKSLGFKYIWIDSLCIVQDDAEDWKHESVRMGSVYGRSGLNIAATAASDGQVGCWLPRDTDWRSHVLLGNGGSTPRLYECFPPEMLNPGNERIPLMTRAWVVQERFLSPRTLHFTKDQAFWVCQSVTACEVWPEGIPRVQHYLECSLDLPKGSNWLSREGWPTIVEQYSSCNLTFGRDKLVAISAIAQLVQKKTPDGYVAGMWQSDLAAELCWSTSRGRRYTPSTAPSWSWASNSAPISYFNSAPYTFPVTKHYIEICSINIEYSTPSNPFGEIISGTLEIRCEYLKECDVYAKEENSGIIIDEKRTLRGRTIIEGMGFDHWEEYAGVEIFRAFWLPIAYLPEPGRHSGIVLQPTGVRQGEYRRIGSASVQRSGNSDLHFPSEPFRPREEYCARVDTTGGGKQEFYISIV
ncbi:heterokaryon incompatibility protein-domain-containing protein [Fusarium avenaceum]|nr:heterokaryon incompatibility protein-domain-containing protein [Fusarium avenaceum]